jgi:hypothetical protein
VYPPAFGGSMPPPIAVPVAVSRVEPLHIEAARPPVCRKCRACAGVGDRVALQGHGIRWRTVVHVTSSGAVLAVVGVRRFKCSRCSWTTTVPPVPIVPGHSYTVAAILTAWLLGLPRPLGDGRDEASVCALQGVDRRTGQRRQRRWRSPSRWMRAIDRWWPTRPQVGSARERASRLLHGFVPGDGGREGVIRRALRAHSAGGLAM